MNVCLSLAVGTDTEKATEPGSNPLLLVHLQLRSRGQCSETLRAGAQTAGSGRQTGRERAACQRSRGLRRRWGWG